MDPLIWLARMRYWLQRRPARWQVLTAAAVIALAAVLYGIEHFWGWPDFLTVNRTPRPPRLP